MIDRIRKNYKTFGLGFLSLNNRVITPKEINKIIDQLNLKIAELEERIEALES